MTAAIADWQQDTGSVDLRGWDPRAADRAAELLEERARDLALRIVRGSGDEPASAVLRRVSEATSADAAAAAIVGLLSDGEIRLTGQHRLRPGRPAGQ